MLARIFGRNRNVTASVGKVRAGNPRKEVHAAVAARRQACLSARRDAVIVGPHDEVDHTGNSIRTVDRRVTAGDDIDTVDQVDRNGVDVDAVVARRAADMAATIDQHQRTGRAEAAKVEIVQTGGADEAARVAAGEGRTQRGKVVQRVAERNLTGSRQVVDSDRGQGNG